MDASKPQTILITGAGGFLGNQLAAALLADKSLNITELVMSDIVPPRDPPGFTNDQRITKVTADVGDVKAVDQLFQGKQYTVVAAFHGLMSGGSEADFEGGMKANLDSTRLMLDKIRTSNYEAPPLFLFTSSGAVYGGLKPGEIVTDDTTPTPQGSYGIQKYICEQLCFDYSRRGWIDARIVRLPTIVVRPGKPNTALSSYASNIVREPLKGESTVCPVPLDFPIFVSSWHTIVHNFVHLLRVPSSKYPAHTRTCALPGIKVTTQEILDALKQVGGQEAVDRVEVRPDPTVRKVVDTWSPEWRTDRALELGCKQDKSILEAVQVYKEMLDSGSG